MLCFGGDSLPPLKRYNALGQQQQQQQQVYGIGDDGEIIIVMKFGALFLVCVCGAVRLDLLF